MVEGKKSAESESIELLAELERIARDEQYKRSAPKPVPRESDPNILRPHMEAQRSALCPASTPLRANGVHEFVPGAAMRVQLKKLRIDAAPFLFISQDAPAKDDRSLPIVSASEKLDVVATPAATESAKAEPKATSKEASKQQSDEEAEVMKIEAEVANAEAIEVMDELAAGAKLEGTAAELELQARKVAARVEEQGELRSNWVCC